MRRLHLKISAKYASGICLFPASADVLARGREKELLNKPFRPQKKKNPPSFLRPLLLSNRAIIRDQQLRTSLVVCSDGIPVDLEVNTSST
jgi:hypothetical protein